MTYSMDELLKMGSNSQSAPKSSVPQSMTVPEINASLNQTGKTNLGVIGNWKLGRYLNECNFNLAKAQVDTRTSIALKLATESLNQQATLIYEQMHIGFVKQLSALQREGVTGQESAIRQLESLIFMAVETFLKDRHSQINRMKELHSQGIIAQEELPKEINILMNHYNNRRSQIQSMLDDQIAAIRGYQNGKRLSFL